MLKYDINYFKNLRRQCYVDAINYKLSGKIVVGYFGKIDEAFLRAFDFYPIPIVSVDGYIFKYGEVNDDCDAINSTRIYLETNKCPLLFSSEFIFYDDTCPIFVEKIKNSTDKDFIHMDSLKNILENKYQFDEEKFKASKDKLYKIKEKIELLTKTDIDSKLLSYVKFYLHYIFDLDKRIFILDELIKNQNNFNVDRKIIKLACPYGILEGIEGENYDIIESTYKTDFAPNKCTFCDKYINYEV